MTAAMKANRDEHTPATILVVEEDSKLLDNIVGQLLNSGYSVQKSDKGKDGLHLISEQQPNLILASTTLPDLKGIQYKYRDEKVIERTLELELGRVVARLEPLFVLKI